MLFALVLAHAADLQFSYTPNPGPNEQPALLLTPSRDVRELHMACTLGGQLDERTLTDLPAGVQQRVDLLRDPAITSASCGLRTVFQDGYVELFEAEVGWSFGGGLSVDLLHASADLDAHTLTFSVTAPVDHAEVVAYGAHRVELGRARIGLADGPGAVTVPWVGDPADVVLLDVKVVDGAGAWASFTYSPWFLEIPHDDVLFATNMADVPADEAWKLERTLQELNEVLEKYGDVVPVQLYIGGCTDTVGDAGHNQDLSNRRARAIATWLRTHGYAGPIYYNGFGERWLAVPTGDGVDEQRNRRAVYMVGANPPPPSTGVPTVRWSEL